MGLHVQGFLSPSEQNPNGKQHAHAASAVLHAFALCDLPEKSLLLMDSDRCVTATLKRVFSEAAFCGFDPPPRVSKCQADAQARPWPSSSRE